MADFDPTKIPVEMPPPVGFMILRIYSRLRARVRFGVDDYLAAAAVVVSCGFCGVILSNGPSCCLSELLCHVDTDHVPVSDDLYGRHAWNVPFSAINTTISRIMIWAGIIVVAASYTAFFISWMVLSIPSPSEKGWMDPVYVQRTAAGTIPHSVGLGVVGTVTDFYILVIPLTAISGLKMTVARKIGISALFATGILACSFSAASLAKRVDTYRARFIDKHSDPLWLSMIAYALAVAETNLGIVCACVPITFPTFKGLAEKASNSWGSWKGYRSRQRIPSLTPKGSTDYTSHASATQRGLPSVPKGTLHTLLSFVRGPQTSQRGEKSQGITVTQDTDIEMSPRSGGRSWEAGNIVPPALSSGRNVMLAD
ncbi:hypothetical protein KVR01_000412 [Diaporthe batatas]|uniref:uncharacterized protein n=1 Tax=Diaporthe batatas TaxID=748121 RepID=UPI001D04B475|nr:uncharacterized protein KVR01_000412 [Diaporthe batatas]KAG8169667.1 hypothetical protein KVR01_000412 [Diaporthe batatas]